MQLETIIEEDSALLVLPVWAPGSYLVREFSRNVEDVRYTEDQKELKKLSKNKWLIERKGKISIEYEVYANELTVRTSHVDESHAYLNGTSIFFYINKRKNDEFQVEFKLPETWSKISTSLRKKTKLNYVANDYDELADSPIEIGNQTEFSFLAEDVLHKVALYNILECDTSKLKEDMSKIVMAATQVFKTHPIKGGGYLFIVHGTNRPGGGLEHQFSTTLQAFPYSFKGQPHYNNFLNLVAHEYFHLWNIKRLRPVGLGPFNYEKEVYTTSLWFVEGVTSYYDDLISYRCGVWSEKKFFSTIAGNINQDMNYEGARVQSVTESSFDAWIKLYRPDENTRNSTISYYSKGALVAAMLDIQIIKQTKGRKSLDDVMAEMYQRHHDKPYTEADILDVVNHISNQDFSEFFENYIYKPGEIKFEEIFNSIGVKLNNRNKNVKKFTLGVSLQGTKVTMVSKNSAASAAGLSTQDEIISIDGVRFKGKLENHFLGKQEGDQLTLLISRSDLIMEKKIKLQFNSYKSYVLAKDLEATKSQKSYSEKWLEK